MTRNRYPLWMYLLYTGYCVLAGTVAALIVFALAYAQEVALWNWTISLGPDFYVASGMAAFAFAVTAWAYWRER
jgi:hypothetical protein